MIFLSNLDVNYADFFFSQSMIAFYLINVSCQLI